MTLLLFACVATDVSPLGDADTGVVPEEEAGQEGLDETEVDEGSEDPGTPAPTALLVAERTAVATSLHVAWSSPLPEASWLEVVDADGTTHEIWPQDELEAWILAPSGTTVTVTAATELGESVEYSDSVELSTGELPDGFELELPEIADGSLMQHRLTLSAWDDAGGKVALQNPQGEVVWYRVADSEEQTSMAARLLHSGDGVILSDYGLSRTGESLEGMAQNRVLGFGWGGEQLAELATPGGHHFFDLQDDDSVIWLQAESYDVDGVGEPVAFDAAVSSELGEVFGSADVSFDATQCNNPTGYYRDVCDAHHMNSVDCDLDAGRCIASLHASDRVVEFSSVTGELLHDFSAWSQDLPDALTTAFNGAHDVQYVDGGAAMLVFNTAKDRGAWAARYELDRQAEQLSASWAHNADGCLYANAAGGIQALPDGHVLVNYGSPSGILHEVDADGEVVWRDSRSGWSDSQACMIEYDREEESLLGEVRSYGLDVLRGVLVL